MAGRMHNSKGYALISGSNDILVGRVIADARAGLATGAMLGFWLHLQATKSTKTHKEGGTTYRQGPGERPAHQPGLQAMTWAGSSPCNISFSF
jgi:hypothetical protein